MRLILIGISLTLLTGFVLAQKEEKREGKVIAPVGNYSSYGMSKDEFERTIGNTNE